MAEASPDTRRSLGWSLGLSALAAAVWVSALQLLVMHVRASLPSLHQGGWLDEVAVAAGGLGVMFGPGIVALLAADLARAGRRERILASIAAGMAGGFVNALAVWRYNLHAGLFAHPRVVVGILGDVVAMGVGLSLAALFVTWLAARHFRRRARPATEPLIDPPASEAED